MAAGQLVAKIPKLERVATYLRYSRKGRDGSGLPPLEDDLDTPQSAIYLLPLLIDIVELSDIRDISLRDAAMALRDDPKYHAHMLSITIDELMKRAKTQAQERVVKDVSIAEIRVGDILINDLRGDSGELLLTGGSQLTDLLLKRLKTLAERTAPSRNRLRLDALHKSAIRFGPHTAFFGRAVQLACYRSKSRRSVGGSKTHCGSSSQPRSRWTEVSAVQSPALDVHPDKTPVRLFDQLALACLGEHLVAGGDQVVGRLQIAMPGILGRQDRSLEQLGIGVLRVFEHRPRRPHFDHHCLFA